MARFDLSKILVELEKASVEEQIKAYQSVKEFVVKQLISEKSGFEEKVKELQAIIDEMKKIE